MYVVFFTVRVPDQCGAFYSDACLMRALQSRGHTVQLLCINPGAMTSGVYEGIPWKYYRYAGKELDQSQVWMVPHYPIAPTVRGLNRTYKRPIIFTLHFPGAPAMFRFVGPIEWSETFWHVNRHIPLQLEREVPYLPNHVRSNYQLMRPFMDSRKCHVESTGDCITLINSNLNKGLKTFVEIARRMPDRKFLGVRSYYHLPTDVFLDVPPNIEWIDFDQDIRNIYARTRILLVPSSYESFCMVAAEAMSNGIPVLYTRPSNVRVIYTYGSTEGIEDWIDPAGIQCDLQNPDEWVQKIRELEDDEVYAARSQQVRDHVAPYMDSAPAAVSWLEQFVREHPVRTNTLTTIQYSERRSQAGPERTLTAIPRPPPGQSVSWRGGRLSFGRR